MGENGGGGGGKEGVVGNGWEREGAKGQRKARLSGMLESTFLRVGKNYCLLLIH